MDIWPPCLFIGFGKIIQKLIENGADLNAVDDNRNSALIYAASEGKKKFKSSQYKPLSKQK